MISVLSRLPLLSGNKHLGLVFIPLLLISCGAFKKTAKVEWPKDEVVTVKPDKRSETPKKDDKDENTKKDEKKLTYATVTFRGESFRVPEHNGDFHIAVLLPFHSDGINSDIDKRRGAVMLEYYQGMKLAIEEAKLLGSKFTIHVYDTDNDTNELRKILRKPELDNADLIIGPTDEDQVRIAAYFAKTREIPMFSPLTTLDRMWSDNPFVYTLNPTDEIKAQEFLKYYTANHPKEKLLIVRDGKRFDRSFGAALVAECEKQKIPFSKVALTQWMKWKDHLGTEKTVVVATCEEKTSVTDVVAGLLYNARNITLVGSDKWLKFNNVDYTQWAKLKATFLSTNKAEVPNEKAKELMNNYRLAYNDDPSFYSYMGYDQLLFGCEILDAFGGYFPLFITEKKITYTNMDMQMEKGATSVNNRFIQMYRLEDFQLIPLTY